MENLDLIKILNDCAAHCNYCADACLDEDDPRKMIDCIRTDRACAVICTATANLLSTNFSDIRALINYCSDICKKCAQECEMHDNQHCKECAASCRECSDACLSYLI
ncbi:four-helix bundle copper-binding protein [Membranihabitans maritimus]|uniref:four-helix bundle copper-binding protein n=1 Tax=Membranihabitans maritimus TaxID=2904244 RepID=UPI0034E19A48